MHPLQSLLVRLAFALALTTPLAVAQIPKVGNNVYKDTSELGFRVKVPDGWDLIPPQPGDPNLIAKYDPPVNKYIVLQTSADGRSRVLWLHCWILKFDHRPRPKDEKKPDFGSKPLKDVGAFLKENVEEGSRLKIVSEKPFKVDKVEATEIQYSTPDDPKDAPRYWACVYTLKPEIDVAIVFSGPADPKKWVRWEGVFETMAKSFALEATKEVVGGTAQGDTLRDKKRAELNRTLATQPGWKLYETPNYFVVTPHTDRAFVQELLQRLEAIRTIYEVDYPAAKAEEYKKIGESAKTGEASAQDKAKEEIEKALFSDGADPREMSKCSVVRVFTEQGAYHSYGGPPSSAGYWSAYHKELVLFDDQAGGGRNDTWIVLNHEAFHQYIFYFYGNISPHSWYNEGTGDFYSGYFWKNGKFTLKENSWRKSTIAENVKGKSFAPLETFVRWSQAEYYGQNELGLGGGENYAQGWSLIYFLRTGKKKNAKGWDPAWDNILETYLRVLAMSGKLDQAVDEAFKGIDMKALEAAWIDYTR